MSFRSHRAQSQSNEKITKLMSILAAGVACVIAFTIPGIYYTISMTETKNTHKIETDLLAKSIEKIIQARPDLWEYESLRLKALISKPLILVEEDEREILTAEGKLVSKNDFTVARPIISISESFYDSGRLAGSIVVRASIRTQILNTAILGIFSSLLGCLIYYIFRIYPLSKLENTLLDLKQEMDKSDKTLYAIGDGVITVDQHGKIQFINRAAKAHIGMDTSEAVGRQLEEVYVLRHSQENKAGVTTDKELILTGKDGREYPIEEVRTNLIETGEGESGTVIVFRDVSERKKACEEKLALEQQLNQAQKMESLGVLAGGIAHDFNNILAVIICNCSLAIQRPTMAEELIPEIETAAQRAAELCRQMLAYAGKTQFIMKQVNTKSLVEDMLKMLQATLSKNVVIKPSFSNDNLTIKADATHIRQIVMNLIINASEAIGENQGEICVSLTNTEVSPFQSENDYHGKAIPPGRYVCLEVADNGCGMDYETQKRIFEPFYTTKFTGRGLGMSSVLGIITSHKGTLQLYSQPGRGSTFKVYLPVETGKTDVDLVQQIAPAPWRGSGTILLVEDEPQLMTVAKNLIKSLGFMVFEAANGLEALELYRKNAEYITLVVTDIGMPVMDGYKLFRELKKINPELPIIVSSGYGDATVTSRIAEEEAAGFLSKPYNFDQLRKVLKRVVENIAPKHS